MQSIPPDKPISQSANAFPDHAAGWSWSEDSQKEWRKVTGEDEEYVAFYKLWRNPATRPTFDTNFPYKLWIGEGPSLSPAGKPILITEAYDKMFRRLLCLREEDLEGGEVKGAVITGQPGIGKTTFQKFLLAKLISAQEVVLLSGSSSILLFYRGELYRRLLSGGFLFLPTPPLRKYYPIWALIDVTYLHEPPIEESSNIWPVQTSSPNPIRWNSWSKHNNAAIYGMPQWDMDELLEGLPLQRRYDTFQLRLDAQLRSPTTFNAIQDETIAAAMEVLQIETARLAQSKAAAAADWDKGIMPMVVDGEAQPLPKFDETEAFKILVRNATEEFGFAPRDVYNGVFSLPTVKRKHATKIKDLGYSELMSIADTFTKNCLLNNLSHQVVAVQPCKYSTYLDDWTIDFKSPRIAKEVVRLMLSLEHRYLRDTYHLLRNISPGMGGALFEAIAHRVLCGNDVPQPTNMIRSTETPPTFTAPQVLRSITTDSDDGTPSTFPTPPPYKTVKDHITLNLLHGLREVTSDDNRYYVPTSATNPLFDSFTVAFDPDNHAAVVSVFQITTSTEHRGSADGYLLIRKIIARARELLSCPPRRKANISVRYVLVCPDDGSQHRWTMPKGWNEDNTVNNQIGEGFCIRVPSHYLAPGPTMR